MILVSALVRRSNVSSKKVFLQSIWTKSKANFICFLSSKVRIPDYRLFLPIRNETFEIFDSNLHPIETTILQLRIVASNRSGIPLSAFRFIDDKHDNLLDHIRLSQYDIGEFLSRVSHSTRTKVSANFLLWWKDYRATLTMQTWTGWSDFFTYAIKGIYFYRLFFFKTYSIVWSN